MTHNLGLFVLSLGSLRSSCILYMDLQRPVTHSREPEELDLVFKQCVTVNSKLKNTAVH